jgi:hypothetical protein
MDPWPTTSSLPNLLFVLPAVLIAAIIMVKKRSYVQGNSKRSMRIPAETLSKYCSECETEISLDAVFGPSCENKQEYYGR